MSEEAGGQQRYNRELSWLSFNYRVLQEARDKRVPLIERLRFLAIYSSNLDEFYRVRVASIRSLADLKKKAKRKLDFSPKKLLKEINRRVEAQQQEFGQIFRQQLIPGLAEKGIFILTDDELTDEQREFARTYFIREIFPILRYGEFDGEDSPFLQDKLIYMVVESEDQEDPALLHRHLLEIPSGKLGRFLVLPNDEGKHTVMFIDDVMRVSLDILFPKALNPRSYSIKLSRDADLNIEDEFSGDLVDKIRKSLIQRSVGAPSRLLYDESMPEGMVEFLTHVYDLEENEAIPGGKYHNFSDYWGFPLPDQPELLYPKMEPLKHPELEHVPSMLDAIAERDHLLHFPYQSFDYVTRLIEEAADDPNVVSIKITLYRVASDSKVAKALIRAAENGKDVEVFDEVKARFDEESNIYWGNELSKAGARVRYSYPDLKVHTKICLIKRKEPSGSKRYAYLGTGNFNEKTARIYCDHALLTSHEEITKDMDRVFKFLMEFKLAPEFKHLLVAPFNLRKELVKLIDQEIAAAQAGQPARIIAKMNSLEDQGMIEKLYEAGQAGVEVQLIVRGICCMITESPDLSPNITAISIVDRFLEHARVFVFHQQGEERMYVGSADLMGRNLNRRTEVVFPIFDTQLKAEISQILQLQMADNEKARVINHEQDNPYVQREGEPVRAQMATYEYLSGKRD